jgi:hypothetical protein
MFSKQKSERVQKVPAASIDEVKKEGSRETDHHN